MRLALLRANDDFIGVIGLLEDTSPDGKDGIAVRVSVVWDPDGCFVELNQLLGPAAGTESR